MATLVIYSKDSSFGVSKVAFVMLDGHDLGLLRPDLAIKITGVPCGKHTMKVLNTDGFGHPVHHHAKDANDHHMTEIDVVDGVNYFEFHSEFIPAPITGYTAEGIIAGAIIDSATGQRKKHEEALKKGKIIERGCQESQEKHGKHISFEKDYSALAGQEAADTVHVTKEVHDEADPSKACLIIVHHSTGIVAHQQVCELDINGKRVPRLLQVKQGVRLFVEPGTVVIDSHHTHPASQMPVEKKFTTRKMHVEAGHTYYLNAKWWSGLWYGHFKMADCKPKEAENCEIQTISLQ